MERSAQSPQPIGKFVLLGRRDAAVNDPHGKRGHVGVELELFAQAAITRLTELRIAVLEDCVEAELALGRHAVLCAELTLAVTEHPLRERLWSQLIRALYRCGRQAETLGAYARLRKQLAELLGIDPSPELTRLHEAVLTQRPPDQVTIALAVDDLDTARSAAAELAESAQTYGSKALLAAAQAASGALALATGEGDPLPSLRRGVELWHEARSPYESARVRMVLATALDRAGQPEAACLEMAAARACFDRLGARLDAEAAATELLIITGERVRS